MRCSVCAGVMCEERFRQRKNALLQRGLDTYG